jgi:hypothetical protein
MERRKKKKTKPQNKQKTSKGAKDLNQISKFYPIIYIVQNSTTQKDIYSFQVYMEQLLKQIID